MPKQPVTTRISILFLVFFFLLAAGNSFAQPGERLSSAAKTDFQNGDYNACVQEYTSLIAAQPNNDDYYAERSRCHYLKGVRLTDAAADAEILLAFTDAEKALQLNSKNTAALVVRGIVQSYRKDEAGAIVDFSKAIAIDPKLQKAYYNRAAGKTALRDFEGAIADYTKLIQINPQFAAAYANRGKLYGRLRKTEQAITDLRRALELDPNDQTAATALARLDGTATRATTSSESNSANTQSAGNCVSGNCVNGYGKYVYSIGNYEGDFVGGKREGRGTFSTNSGDVYTGQFTNDTYNGKGKYKYATGNIYEGDWVNGKQEGRGTYMAANGDVYVGQYANGQYNGKGKYKFANGEIYEGNWANEKMQGQGTYTYQNGNYSIGNWEQGILNGAGKYYDRSTNALQEGYWNRGSFTPTATRAGAQTKETSGATSVRQMESQLTELQRLVVYTERVTALQNEIDPWLAKLSATPANDSKNQRTVRLALYDKMMPLRSYLATALLELREFTSPEGQQLYKQLSGLFATINETMGRLL